MVQVARVQTGPEVGGTRPVLVTFEEFADRENVLRKAGMLRGSNIHVTEDLSRYLLRAADATEWFTENGKMMEVHCSACVLHWCRVVSGLQEGAGEPGGATQVHAGGEATQPGRRPQSAVRQGGQLSPHHPSLQNSLVYNDRRFLSVAVLL